MIHSWPPDDFELDESALFEADGAPISDDSAGSELLLGLPVKSTETLDRVGIRIRIRYEFEGVQYATFIPPSCGSVPRTDSRKLSHKRAAPSDWLDTERATSDEFQTGPASGQP